MPSYYREVWKDVLRCKGEYEVSSKGRVKSLERISYDKFGNPYLILERILKPFTSGGGYQVVNLRGKSRKGKCYVHVLVLEAFVGERPKDLVACHFPNQDPKDNRVENLRWDTVLNNNREQAHPGCDNAGEKHPNARMTEKQVLKALEMYRSGKHTRNEICQELKQPKTRIDAVLSGSSWSYLGWDAALNKKINRIHKSTRSRGASNSNARMTERQALEAIAMHKSGTYTRKDICKELKQPKSRVDDLLSGRCWKHLPR